MAGKKDAMTDSTKPRLSLIPKRALWALGKSLTYGEKHYGAHNWRAGIPISILMDSTLRHINQFNDGEDVDQPSQCLHLGNALANICMAIELIETKPEWDDRYKETTDHALSNDIEMALNDSEYGYKIVKVGGQEWVITTEGIYSVEQAREMGIIT